MKKVVIEMINDELSGGSNAEIGLKLGDLISQSFQWWQAHLGDRKGLDLAGWRLDSIEVRDIRPAP